MDYNAVKTLHETLPSFSPYVPVVLLPYLALCLLTLTLALAFYFTTLPSNTFPLREGIIATASSVLGGFGVVFLFCVAGVYV